jgi:hypothetical protein
MMNPLSQRETMPMAHVSMARTLARKRAAMVGRPLGIAGRVDKGPARETGAPHNGIGIVKTVVVATPVPVKENVAVARPARARTGAPRKAEIETKAMAAETPHTEGAAQKRARKPKASA